MIKKITCEYSGHWDRYRKLTIEFWEPPVKVSKTFDEENETTDDAEQISIVLEKAIRQFFT